LGAYSIKDLEKLSGIKAHTIRIWEQRYQIILPHRTQTNIRVYDDQQLKKLLNISLLVKHGFKISKLSKLPTEEINKQLQEVYQLVYEKAAHQTENYYINSLVVAMIDLDEEKFEKIFSTCVLRYGFEPTIMQVIYPFLEKVGLMWGIDEINPAQEHFISNLIRQKLIVAIDGLPIPPKENNKFILFLPEGELHEMGLLLANYLLKNKKQQIVYLGQNVPIHDLESVTKLCQPQFLLTFIITTKPKPEIEAYIETLSKKFSQKTILISGNITLAEGIKRFPNIYYLNNVSSINNYISES